MYGYPNGWGGHPSGGGGPGGNHPPNPNGGHYPNIPSRLVEFKLSESKLNLEICSTWLADEASKQALSIGLLSLLFSNAKRRFALLSDDKYFLFVPSSFETRVTLRKIWEIGCSFCAVKLFVECHTKIKSRKKKLRPFPKGRIWSCWESKSKDVKSTSLLATRRNN